ncbi:hypothetical protein [Puniceicoccus vermicola]
MEEYLRGVWDDEMPNAREDPAGALKDNCNTRISNALKAAGIDVDISAFPAFLQRDLEDVMRKNKTGFGLSHAKDAPDASNYGIFDKP